jgi:hypothetical protein
VKGRDLSRLRVAPGSKVVLADFDPDFVPQWAAEVQPESSVARLAEYQERLAAQATHGLLVVLQGITPPARTGRSATF